MANPHDQRFDPIPPSHPMPRHRNIAHASADQILGWLAEDGFPVPFSMAAADRLAEAIRAAAQAGALLWTPERVTSTQVNNHIDLRRGD